MTGPGVNVFTTLDNGCSSDNVIGTSTLQPSSTYTLEDLNQPAVTKMTITTLAGGTPQLPTTEPVRHDVGQGHALDGPDRIERARRGTLQGKLAANGKLTLTMKGKPVSKLQSGRYTFAISDQDSNGGVTLQVNVKNVEATQLSASRSSARRRRRCCSRPVAGPSPRRAAGPTRSPFPVHPPRPWRTCRTHRACEPFAVFFS